MSILNSLFSNSSLTDAIIKKFVDDYKKQGIKQVLISINEDDSLKVDKIEQSKILIDKSNYDFLIDIFDKFKKQNLSQ